MRGSQSTNDRLPGLKSESVSLMVSLISRPHASVLVNERMKPRGCSAGRGKVRARRLTSWAGESSLGAEGWGGLMVWLRGWLRGGAPYRPSHAAPACTRSRHFEVRYVVRCSTSNRTTVLLVVWLRRLSPTSSPPPLSALGRASLPGARAPEWAAREGVLDGRFTISRHQDIERCCGSGKDVNKQST